MREISYDLYAQAHVNALIACSRLSVSGDARLKKRARDERDEWDLVKTNDTKIMRCRDGQCNTEELKNPETEEAVVYDKDLLEKP